MQRIKKQLVLLVMLLMSTQAWSAPGNNALDNKEKLDSRIEQWVQKTCGNDAACAAEKRAQYIKRMAGYKQYVQKTCGDDQACRQDMRAKYMQRRAKREARIAEHCGDDEACRDALREEYNQRMDEARNKCKEDKACWHNFYNEHKPQ